jgi:TrmH family RNA methyltransferase
MVITSRSNSLIKKARSLSTSKGRREEGNWLLEGIRTIEEAIRHKAVFSVMFHTQAALENGRVKAAVSRVRAEGISIYEITEEVLKSISDTQNPSGIVAVIKSPDIPTDLTLPKDGWILVLDNIADPGNMGTIFRTALAVEVDGVILLPGCVDPGNPKVIRSSVGAVLGLPLFRLSINEFIVWLESSRTELITLDVNGTEDLYQVDWTGPKALLIGNEAWGPSAQFDNVPSHKVCIPMSNRVESLNVAIATGVALYEAYRQRQLTD